MRVRIGRKECGEEKIYYNVEIRGHGCSLSIAA